MSKPKCFFSVVIFGINPKRIYSSFFSWAMMYNLGIGFLFTFDVVVVFNIRVFSEGQVCVCVCVCLEQSTNNQKKKNKIKNNRESQMLTKHTNTFSLVMMIFATDKYTHTRQWQPSNRMKKKLIGFCCIM